MPPRNQQPDQGDVRQAAQDRQRQRREQVEDPGQELALRPDQTQFDAVQLAALEQLGVKQATPADLAIYLEFCKRTGLNPFAKQVYMIPRRQWDSFEKREVVKQTIQVGIDGFRLIRDRAEEARGFFCEFEETIWYDKQGTEYGVWLFDVPPTACKVVLLKVLADGTKLRFPCTLMFESYAARKNDNSKDLIGRWKTDPTHQIEKCCEAGATRRGVPQELGGVYLDVEMENVGEPAPAGPGRRPRRGRAAPSAGPKVTVLGTDGQPAAEPPPPDPAGPDTDLAEKLAGTLRGIMATLNEFGWAGDDDESRHTRANVIAALGRERDADAPLVINSTSDLDLFTATRVKEALHAWAAERDGDKQEVHASLARLSEAVDAYRAQHPATAAS
jgi:phage recombination protein Bet